MLKKISIDPNKPFFIFDTRGDWHATVIRGYIFDTRGEYIGFIRGENHDVYTSMGEWIGNLYSDGRILRKRNLETRPSQLKSLPPKPEKPNNLPPRAHLPPLFSELGFDKIDVLEWDSEIFKRVSDLHADMD